MWACHHTNLWGYDDAPYSSPASKFQELHCDLTADSQAHLEAALSSCDSVSSANAAANRGIESWDHNL